MNAKLSEIAQEMCNIKSSFDKLFILLDEDKSAVEAFGLYDDMMRKLGEGFAAILVSGK